ncbi:MAG: hypothetical protein WCP57_09690 [Bacteroidota bacterium]
MKKLILLMFVVLSFSSCKKTAEAITLLGKWEVDSYSENGIDKTTIYKASYLNYLLMFDASNNYIETYTLAGINITNAGTWKMTNGGDDFELTNQVDGSKRFFHVIEINLASASVSEDSGVKEYHLLKK